MPRSHVALALAVLLALLASTPWMFEQLAGIEGLAYLPIALVVVASFAGVGLALFRALNVTAPAWLAIAVGAPVVGHAQLLLGHLGLFGRATSAVLVLIGLALLAMQRRELSASIARLPRIHAGWAFACAPFVVGALILCSAPPTFYDALVYHVALVEQAIARGSLVVTPHDMFTAMPFAAELAAGTAFAIGGAPEAMSLVQALWFAVLVVAVAETARSLFDDERAAGPAALVVASLPLPMFLAAGTKPDLLAALLFLAAIRALTFSADGARVDVKVALPALGLACATKLSAVPAALAFVAVLAIIPSTRRAMLVDKRALGLAILIGAALALPPYVRNLIAFGNPFYPFASSIFGGPAWLAHTSALLNGDAQRVRVAADVGELLARPFFSTDATANEVLGALPLFAVLAFIIARTRAVLVVGALLLASLPGWLTSHALPRHNAVLWLGLALLAGLVLSRLIAVRSLAPVVVVALAAMLFVNASWSIRANEAVLRGPSRSIAGAAERSEVMARAVDVWPALQAAGASARAVPDGQGCVFVATGDPRVVGLEVRAVLSEVYAMPALVALLVQTGGDPAGVAAGIRGTERPTSSSAAPRPASTGGAVGTWTAACWATSSSSGRRCTRTLTRLCCRSPNRSLDRATGSSQPPGELGPKISDKRSVRRACARPASW